MSNKDKRNRLAISNNLKSLCGKLRSYPAFEEAAFIFIGAALGLLLRFYLRGFMTDDYVHSFNPWYELIRQYGWTSLKMNFSNYPPLYLYMLYAISTLLPKLSNVTAIKIPSILSDLICAWYIYQIVRLRYKDGLVPILAFYAILFAPTVVLNGAMWGQIESVFTAPLIACIYFLLKKRYGLACFAFGIGFAIKFQAIYLAPFLFVLCVKRILPWKYIPIIPTVYLISIVPAWIAGRPLLDLLLIYTGQVSAIQFLVLNAPSMYIFFNENLSTLLFPAGVVFCASMCLMYVMIVYKSKTSLSSQDLILLAALSSVMVPYFLPRTHDRYFYPADVLSILFAFYFVKYYYIALAMNLTSFFSYQYYLLFHLSPQGRIDIPMPLLALVTLGIIVVLARQMILRLHNRADHQENGIRPVLG